MEVAIKKSLYEVLSSIQKELKAPKKNRNDFGKYNFRNCEDILEAVKKLLPDGYVIQLSDEIVQIGSRYYVKAIARLSNDEAAADCVAYAREAEVKKGMDESQITGSASSYARKYALAGLFAIDGEKDADATNKHTKDKEPEFTPEQKKAKAREYVSEVLEEIGEVDSEGVRSILHREAKKMTRLSESYPEMYEEIQEIIRNKE